VSAWLMKTRRHCPLEWIGAGVMPLLWRMFLGNCSEKNGGIALHAAHKFESERRQFSSWGSGQRPEKILSSREVFALLLALLGWHP
jgi:hypothetical protein